MPYEHTFSDGKVTMKEVAAPDPEPLPEAAGADFMEAFGTLAGPIVHEVEIEIAGKPYLFHVKQHSISDAAMIEAKRFRKNGNGAIVRDTAHEEINAIRYEIYYSLVKNLGTSEAPNWEPLMSLAAIDAMLQDPRDEVKQLVNRLSLEVWKVNAELDPLKKMRALQAIQKSSA